MAKWTTGRFVPVVIVGVRDGNGIGCRIFLRMAFYIRTGQARQQQQPQRKKVDSPFHARKGRIEGNATGSQKRI